MQAIFKHKSVKSRIVQLLSDTNTDEALKFLEAALPGDAEIYLAGGVIRDILIADIHGSGPRTEDIDVFIANVRTGIRPTDILDKEQIEITDLSGVRWWPQKATLPLDISLLEDFVIIEKYEMEPNLKNLLDTIDFTVNAAVFDYKLRELHIKRCAEAVKKRFVDFNTRLFYTKATSAFRALVLKHKTGFRLSEAVFYFLNNDINVETALFLKHLFRSRFDKEKSNLLLADFNRISRYPDYRGYLQSAPECQLDL
jgi:hypothetical protein